MAKVECEFSPNCEDYTCKIISQSILSHQLEVDGNHESGKSNSDVKDVFFVMCTFDKFPRSLHELFSNLSALWIKECKLESISRKDISGLCGLRVLGVINCGLKSLEGDLLRDMKQLAAVSFDGNQLGEIDPDILDGLHHLTFVSFLENATINMRFDSSGYEISLDALKYEIKLKCISSVDSSGEYCCQVSTQSVIRLQVKFAGDHKDGRSADDVEELCFENCTFVVFPKNLYELFSNLSTLRMQNCTLEELNYEQIKNFHKFHFQNGSVKNVKGDIYCDFKQTTNILLCGNQAKNVESEMKNLKKISNILCDEAFKDFTIYVGETSFKIHKLLFAAHSATLAEIFRKNPVTVELNLQDVSKATFKVINDFIYSEKLPENFDNWTELLMAANQLKIEKLVKITIDKLHHSITDANAQAVLELANKFNNEDLREKAFKHLIKKYFPGKTIKKEFSRQPEKLKELIEAKLKLDQKHEEVMKEMENLDIKISQS